MKVETQTSGPTTVAVITGPSQQRTADEERLAAEIKSVVDTANELLLVHGAVLLRGFGIGTPAEVRAAVSCFGEPFTEYLHGNSPRSAVLKRGSIW